MSFLQYDQLLTSNHHQQSPRGDEDVQRPLVKCFDDFTNLPLFTFESIQSTLVVLLVHLRDNMSDVLVLEEVYDSEVLCLVVDPRIDVERRRWRHNTNCGIVWRGIPVQEESCARLGCEVTDVDVNCIPWIVRIRETKECTVERHEPSSRPAYNSWNRCIATPPG